jgi:hypothetical protein
MKRGAEMMSHGPGEKKGAGHFDHLAYVPGHGDGDGWNSSNLNRALNQSDGLMADRSSRGQQRNIGAFVDDRVCNVGRHGLFKSLRVHVIADEAEEIRGQAANRSFRRQLL